MWGTKGLGRTTVVIYGKVMKKLLWVFTLVFWFFTLVFMQEKLLKYKVKKSGHTFGKHTNVRCID